MTPSEFPTQRPFAFLAIIFIVLTLDCSIFGGRDRGPFAQGVIGIEEKPEEEGDASEEINFSSDEEGDDLAELKSDLGVEIEDADAKTKDGHKYKAGATASGIDEDPNEKEFKVDAGGNPIEVSSEDTLEEFPLEGEESDKKSGKGKGNKTISVDGTLQSGLPEKGKKGSSDKKGPKNSINDQNELLDTDFDVGKEEKELLDLAKFIENKIPDKEWSEIAAVPKTDRYVVEEGDYLWIISKKLFGSGFYYSKIWSLNPYITNPHEIKAGMVLLFDTGDADSMPSIQVGEFKAEGNNKDKANQDSFDFNNFGDEAEPNWIKEKKRLLSEGTFVQFATDKTYEDLSKASEISLIKEYENYAPPNNDFLIGMPGDEYDASGFDKNSKVVYNFKEGLSLNTFVTTNLVQDFGEVDSAPKDGGFLSKMDLLYVRFDPSLNIVPGEKYSLYSPMGKVAHPKSDRSGYKYTIVGHVQAVRKVSDLWECVVLENIGLIQRKDRVTSYTPKIDQIIKTFNPRNIEALIVDSYENKKAFLSYGDVVYLDRGRADGVEIGNIFEIYSFIDKATDKKITPDPTYKIGEITVISLTDNFATGLISNSSDEILLGSLSISKTMESAAMANRVAKRGVEKEIQDLENKALDELDVELNLEDINEDLLKKADKIELAEDELEELEKQEREKSIIQRGERDLKELERLEKEIESAETQLNAAKVDEDKNLEQEDLNGIEKRGRADAKDLFDAINEIEKKEGKKYLDEDINSKENPYGLTEFDLEEIDELLNTTSK